MTRTPDTEGSGKSAPPGSGCSRLAGSRWTARRSARQTGPSIHWDWRSWQGSRTQSGALGGTWPPELTWGCSLRGDPGAAAAGHTPPPTPSAALPTAAEANAEPGSAQRPAGDRVGGRRGPPLLAQVLKHSTACHLPELSSKGDRQMHRPNSRPHANQLPWRLPPHAWLWVPHPHPGAAGRGRAEEAGAWWGHVGTRAEMKRCMGVFSENILEETTQGFLQEQWGALAWVERAAARPGSQGHTTATSHATCTQLPGQTQAGPGVRGPPAPLLTLGSSARLRAPSGGSAGSPRRGGLYSSAGCPAKASGQALSPFHPPRATGCPGGHMALGWTDGHQAELWEAGSPRPHLTHQAAPRKGAPRGRAPEGGLAGHPPHAAAPPARGPSVTCEQRRVLETWRGGEQTIRRAPVALPPRGPARGSAPPGRLTWKQQVLILQLCGRERR